MAERNPTRVERALKWLQSGEPSGVERAIDVLQGVVFSFGMKVCGHPADAEDTAQETGTLGAPAGEIPQRAGLLRVALQGREKPLFDEPAKE